MYVGTTSKTTADNAEEIIHLPSKCGGMSEERLFNVSLSIGTDVLAFGTVGLEKDRPALGVDDGGRTGALFLSSPSLPPPVV